jgi:hypothetical protein
MHEFSLLSRIQTSDITAARLPSGEMAIPVNEVERISSSPINTLAAANENSAVFDDGQLGIERHWRGLTRKNGEPAVYSVPNHALKFTESEINGYRAAFGAIASEFASLTGLKQQLDKPSQIRASSEKEVCTSEIGVWQVRSTLLNLGQSKIMLCQRQNEFAVIERFRDESLYTKANGNAQILLQGNDPKQLADEFTANAQHTLRFMASNMVAKAQKIIWTQYPDQRPGRLVAAISERCRQAVSNEETISQTQKMGHSNSTGYRMGI